MSEKIYGPIYGAQRILTVFDDHIQLDQVQNFRSFLTNDFFNGNKDIYYCDMLSCQYREGSSLILGYLQFETAGQSNRNNFGSENSFTFESVLNGQIYTIYQYIRQRISDAKSGIRIAIQPAQPAQEEEPKSKLDELIKMKELLDQHIITHEEFLEYKRNILGLPAMDEPIQLNDVPKEIDYIEDDKIIDVESEIHGDTVIKEFDLAEYNSDLNLLRVGKSIEALNDFKKQGTEINKGTRCHYSAYFAGIYQVMVDGKMLNMTKIEFIYTFFKKD